MITPDGITEEDRRTRVRELADISDAVFRDEILDKKIENSDDIALAMTQGTSTRNTATISNLLCSVLIRTGIGDSENLQTAKEQKELALKIVESMNDNLPEQNSKTSIVTSFGDYLE